MMFAFFLKFFSALNFKPSLEKNIGGINLAGVFLRHERWRKNANKEEEGKNTPDR